MRVLIPSTMLPEAFVFYPTAADECVLCLLIKVAQLGADKDHTKDQTGFSKRTAKSV